MFYSMVRIKIKLCMMCFICSYRLDVKMVIVVGGNFPCMGGVW